MQKSILQLAEIKLVGIKTRTNNAAEFNPATAKISTGMQKYFELALPAKIPNRKNPGTTFCVYAEYENDFNGDFTYFIGEEVTSFGPPPEGMATITISPQAYIKFTTEPGSMPKIVIEAWQKIWVMSPDELGGIRRYHADFEVYETNKVSDPHNTVVDIYIGIQT